jgi:protein involved in polysaccharide export with SLBB domain
MSLSRNWVGRLLVVAMWAGAARASGQTDSSKLPFLNPMATRNELESRLAVVKRDGPPEEANAIGQRLSEGDFAVGDRIVLHVDNQPTLTDTFTVREGQVIHLPGLEDVSMHGVLRSELQGHMYAEVSKFIRNPVVRTDPLLRLSLLGSVRAPGFYNLPADITLSDAFTRAGGLNQSSDLDKAELRRGGTLVLNGKELRTALRNGETLDQLSLRNGDAIDVPDKPSTSNALKILGITAVVVGIVASVVVITRR